jgi:DsbC/DsbD-like thiol-disulfide interchange protein
VDLEGRLDLGVCLDICMPVTLDLTGELLPDMRTRDREIGIALSDRPLTAAEAGAGGAVRGGADLGRSARDRDGDSAADRQ